MGSTAEKMERFHLVFTVVIGLFLVHVDCKAKAPNIVFILADDLGWDDVGFHGSEIRTPNIDKLATEGVILDNYYVQPICTPTRGALLSGKYPIHTGLQHNVIIGSDPWGLPLSHVTIAQRLQSVGYDTHMVGKWHLGFFTKKHLPENRGFNSHFGYYLGEEDYFDHHSIGEGMVGLDFHYNGQALWNFSDQYSTEIYSQRAQDLIVNHNKSKPLFLYLPFQAVHVGNAFDLIQAPLPYVQRFPYIKDPKRRIFAGVVSALDDAVGDIYKALQKSGMVDNTIIVFSTDNGGPAYGFDGNVACNKPLRGMKHTLWEGGVRGVGFVHSPLLKKKRYVNREMMHVTDWYPTLLKAAGVDVKDPVFGDLDGIDQWDVISENKETNRNEILLNIDPIQQFEGFIKKNFKYIYGHTGNRGDWYNCTFPDKKPSFEVDNSKTLLQDYFTEDQSGNYFSNPYYFKIDFDAKVNNTSSTLRELTELIDMVNAEDAKQNADKNLNALLFEPEDREISLDSRAVSEVKKVIVKCGPKPKNASINCDPKKEPCLFNLQKDPCEYFNVAHQYPNIVKKIQERVQEIKKTMVPPGNKPKDPRGDPALHGGVWVPWIKD